ncbi:MAG: hypothetical protein IRY90_20545 [Actinomadura rubrobrunea]|nr:hypothetical protein [Actinomadura rubrobrunea]
MGTSIPREIVEILPGRTDLARVEVAAVRRSINIGLLGEGAVRPGGTRTSSR